MDKMEHKYQTQLSKLRDEFMKAKPLSGTSSLGLVTKSHTSGKRSTVMQDTILINPSETAALH